ncbi:EKC/KEOPS complex subunit BUD32 [Podospora fimiseda]|uniref:EKC/KEOPS complex subunit BUD32 n=1 Tax=Podospora fimiseda TaxID=252190 RepID=A0AAN7H6C0_9PEZI|nr:EKC/KEOPS complex subunit BUD32 [Podospora fimiseda]
MTTNPSQTSTKRPPSPSILNTSPKKSKPSSPQTMTADTPPTASSFPLPKILTNPSSTPPLLITQGAESRLYKSTYLTPSTPCALKYRPPKPWRHATLDSRLRKARTTAEAKVLEKCHRQGVPVPAVYGMDITQGWMAIEWIDGIPVRVAINSHLNNPQQNDESGIKNLLKQIGEAIGNLHKIGIIHGDLTTSNMMLNPENQVILIDFGLAAQSQSDEDRAVDLYVLERAFMSTHPRAEKEFGLVLEAYAQTFKKGKSVLTKLEDVRMRGRKKSMIG